MTRLTRRAALPALVASLGFLGLAGPASAQPDWPNKPVHLIVGFAAGGGSDTVARLLAARMTEMWGQIFVVENRPGAGGQIASELVAKARPDGATILVASASFAIDAAIKPKLPYDPIGGFVPVAMVSSAPYIVVVNAAVPVSTLTDLIALAKRAPGTLNAASAAPGSTQDMAFRLFRAMAGLDIVEVTYQGPDGIPDLVAGRVQMSVTAIPQTSVYLKTGALRALAVTTARRSSVLPELPTVAESGVPGYDVTAWYGALVPAGTPDAIVAKLNAGIASILAEPDTWARLRAAGMEPRGGTQAEFARFIASEFAKWKTIAEAAHLMAD